MIHLSIFVINMANTVRWYELTNWTVKKAIAIGADSLATGLHFDGYNYWIVDQTTDKLQSYVLDNGVFALTKNYALTGYLNPWGLTGDGYDLYVGVLKVVSDVPVAIETRIIKVSKSGVVLKELQSANFGTVGRTYYDLTFDGVNLLASYNVAGAPVTEFIDTIDVKGDTVVNTIGDLARNIEVMAFDGNALKVSLSVAGTSRGGTLARNGTLLSTTVLLPQLAYGMTLVSNKEHLVDVDGWNGESIAVIHRA